MRTSAWRRLRGQASGSPCLAGAFSVRANVFLAIFGLTGGLAVWVAGAQEMPAQDERAVREQAGTTTQPAAPRTLRRPEQAEIIQNLLRDREPSIMIVPQDPEAVIGQRVPTTQPVGAAQEPTLLVDGAIVVERPGRLLYENGEPIFAFFSLDAGPQLNAMQLLPNQLLEAVEREAKLGSSEFVISGRVTRYRGDNYLLLLKALRRVENGNLAP
jgi:hypothetical protein